MLKINYWAVVVAALAAFVMSSLHHSPLLLGNLWRAVDPVATAGIKFDFESEAFKSGTIMTDKSGYCG